MYHIPCKPKGSKRKQKKKKFKRKKSASYQYLRVVLRIPSVKRNGLQIQTAVKVDRRNNIS